MAVLMPGPPSPPAGVQRSFSNKVNDRLQMPVAAAPPSPGRECAIEAILGLRDGVVNDPETLWRLHWRRAASDDQGAERQAARELVEAIKGWFARLKNKFVVVLIYC